MRTITIAICALMLLVTAAEAVDIQPYARGSSDGAEAGVALVLAKADTANDYEALSAELQRVSEKLAETETRVAYIQEQGADGSVVEREISEPVEKNFCGKFGAWHERNKMWLIPVEAVAGGFLAGAAGNELGAWQINELPGTPEGDPDKERGLAADPQATAEDLGTDGDASPIVFGDGNTITISIEK